MKSFIAKAIRWNWGSPETSELWPFVSFLIVNKPCAIQQNRDNFPSISRPIRTLDQHPHRFFKSSQQFYLSNTAKLLIKQPNESSRNADGNEQYSIKEFLPGILSQQQLSFPSASQEDLKSIKNFIIENNFDAEGISSRFAFVRRARKLCLRTKTWNVKCSRLAYALESTNSFALPLQNESSFVFQLNGTTMRTAAKTEIRTYVHVPLSHSIFAPLLPRWRKLFLLAS